MVEYLQAIIFQDADNYTDKDSSIGCDYLLNRALNRYLISVSIRPPRHYDDFGDTKIPLVLVTGDNSSTEETTTSSLDVADALSLRIESIKTSENQSGIANSAFTISVTYNYTQVGMITTLSI